MQKIFNVLISITLSETEKRVLFIVFLLFILLLFLVGLLTHLNDKMIIKQGRKLDKHVSGYVKYGFATNEKEFKKVAKHKNHLLLLKQMVPAIIIIGVTLTAFFIYLNITKQSFSYIWDIYYDMLLRFEVKTTTVLGFIEVWEEWPKLTEDSFVFHGTFEAIVTMQAGNGGEIKGSISSVIVPDTDVSNPGNNVTNPEDLTNNDNMTGDGTQ